MVDDESGAPFDGAPGPLNNFSSFTVRGIQASKRIRIRHARFEVRTEDDKILSKLQSTGLYPLQPPRVPHSASDVSPRSARCHQVSPPANRSRWRPEASFPTRGPHEFIRSARVHHVTSISAEYRQICPRQFQRVK